MSFESYGNLKEGIKLVFIYFPEIYLGPLVKYWYLIKFSVLS